jgi:hypothetical protein
MAKPIHIALGVGAIILTMIVLPIATTAYNRAYPTVGSAEEFMVEQCVEQEGASIRWKPEALAECKAVNNMRRRNGQ